MLKKAAQKKQITNKYRIDHYSPIVIPLNFI